MIDAAPPTVHLNRNQWLRVIVVGLLAAIVLGRSLPDILRIWYPVGTFAYITDDDGRVIRAPQKVGKDEDRLIVGDRVRVDHLKVVARKAGIVRIPFTRDNFDRVLPITRNGRDRNVRLTATTETVPGRAVMLLRIALLVITVLLGSMLVLAKPTGATWAFFFYCLSGQAPSIIADGWFDMPWRTLPALGGDLIRGAGSVELVVFALTFRFAAPHVQRAIVAIGAVAALLVGLMYSYGQYRLNFIGLPGSEILGAYRTLDEVLTAAAMVIFFLSFLRSSGVERQRTGWIVAAFAVAGSAQLLSDRFFPSHLTPLENALMLALTILPVIAVWVAVVKHRFYEVDFVVSRGILWVFILGCVIITIGLGEEIASTLEVNNTDFAQPINTAIFMALGALVQRFHGRIELLIDGFIFPGRRIQRIALEQIGVRILDAETEEEVYHELLDEAPEALGLEFAGIVTHSSDGSYALTHKNNWPDDYDVVLPKNHPLVVAIELSRNVLVFDSKSTKLIRSESFPNERLQFAAPIFFERAVTAIVVFGSNKSGLDLDPTERELLVRVVANASIALNDIELARLRAGVFQLMDRPPPLTPQEVAAQAEEV